MTADRKGQVMERNRNENARAGREEWLDMTKQEYIKQVGRHLQCSGAKKREILKQLDSHIEIALAEGRQLDEILAQMGNPGALAEEFNENLDDKEKKKGRRGRRIVAVVAVILAVLAAAAGYIYWMLPKGRNIEDSKGFDAAKVQARSEEVIELFSEGDYATLESHTSEELLAVLEQTPFSEIKQYIGEDWGELHSIGTVYMAEIHQKSQVYVTAQVNVAYDNVNVTYTLSFNPEMELCGFYIK